MKLFVVSDIHGFYKEFREALDNAGFDPENEEHWLISCGDNWDRGEYPWEVMHYLRNLPRKVLIRGNHEDLFEECVKQGYPDFHDYTNGTVGTIEKLGHAEDGRDFGECCIAADMRTKKFLGDMVNYFETENYIFCHSWIPTICNDGLPAWYRRGRDGSIRQREFKEDWRYAHQSEWYGARWVNPLEMAMRGLCPDKTVVSGHWHCGTGWNYQKRLDGETDIPDDYELSRLGPYNYENKLIMLDACTAYTKKVNVLVLEDNFITEEGDTDVQ